MTNVSKEFSKILEAARTDMTATTHTPEPWNIVGATRIWKTGEDGGAIAIVAEPKCADSSDFAEVRIGSYRWGEAMANARRIVACVNAAAGISTEFLESGANLDRLAKLLEQRDELAAALRNADCGCTLRERDSGHRVGCWKPDADAALAKVAA